MTGRRLVAGSVLVAAVAVACGSGLAVAAVGPPTVGVKARSACITQSVRVSGFVIARDEHGASLDTPGFRVSEILVAIGDRVALNQDLLRAVRLGGTDASGADAPQTAAQTVTLHAPVAGVVSQVATTVGAITGDPAAAAGGRPQVSIDGGSGVDLLVDVPSLYATKIAKGSAARILKLDGSEDAGTVRMPVSLIDPSSQLGQASLAIDRSSALRPGQFASARIDTVHECRVTVPRSAVTVKNGIASVQVVNGPAAVTREVRMGMADGPDVQILDGLASGETVSASASSAVEASDQARQPAPGAPTQPAP